MLVGCKKLLFSKIYLVLLESSRNNSFVSTAITVCEWIGTSATTIGIAVATTTIVAAITSITVIVSIAITEHIFSLVDMIIHY
jgi:hypothetical protein